MLTVFDIFRFVTPLNVYYFIVIDEWFGNNEYEVPRCFNDYWGAYNNSYIDIYVIIPSRKIYKYNI